MAAPKKLSAGQIINQLRKAEVGLANGKRVKQVCRELGVSERKACRVLGQARSTQRRIPKRREDEEALDLHVGVSSCPCVHLDRCCWPLQLRGTRCEPTRTGPEKCKRKMGELVVKEKRLSGSAVQLAQTTHECTGASAATRG